MKAESSMTTIEEVNAKAQELVHQCASMLMVITTALNEGWFEKSKMSPTYLSNYEHAKISMDGTVESMERLQIAMRLLMAQFARNEYVPSRLTHISPPTPHSEEQS